MQSGIELRLLMFRSEIIEPIVESSILPTEAVSVLVHYISVQLLKTSSSSITLSVRGLSIDVRF